MCPTHKMPKIKTQKQHTYMCIRIGGKMKNYILQLISGVRSHIRIIQKHKQTFHFFVISDNIRK